MKKKLKKGQALVEAIIVFPLLILMIWGIWHLHLVSLFKARAAMAARHSAWIKSTKEDSASQALKALRSIFFNKTDENSQESDQINMGYAISSDESFIIDEVSSIGNPDNTSDGFFNFGPVGDLLSGFIDGLKARLPFFNNSKVKIEYEVISPLTNYYKKEDKVSIARKYSQISYFPVRWKRFYYHSSYDFFKGGIGQDTLSEAISSTDSALDDASDSMDDAIDDCDHDVNGPFEYEGNVYTFDDFKEAMEKWKEWSGIF